MNDWNYCQEILPKVSRTFALNIRCLKNDLHRAVLSAYLFCRIVDTVEDAPKLDAIRKIDLLLEFSKLALDSQYRFKHLDEWVEACSVVDGSANDLDLLANTKRVFNVFDTLPSSFQDCIMESVSNMAQGMAFFQKMFDSSKGALLEDGNQLEEYCYYVAGCVGEMLCALFLEECPKISEKSAKIMKETAVSFGLGLQITNIAKDFLTDRKRGWSYIPRSYIVESGLTVERFTAPEFDEKKLKVIQTLLRKTIGHLKDALKFTLAIPRIRLDIRLFCVLPLWMAVETAATLFNNRRLLESEDPVKISRKTVKRIVRRGPILSVSNFLLRWSFESILKRCESGPYPEFDYEDLKKRLDNNELGKSSKPLPV